VLNEKKMKVEERMESSKKQRTERHLFFNMKSFPSPTDFFLPDQRFSFSYSFVWKRKTTSGGKERNIRGRGHNKTLREN
jgi:hypothetical protein